MPPKKAKPKKGGSNSPVPDEEAIQAAKLANLTAITGYITTAIDSSISDAINTSCERRGRVQAAAYAAAVLQNQTKTVLEALPPNLKTGE